MTSTSEPGVATRPSLVRAEIVVVLALSLGAAALYAALGLTRDLLQGSLRGQTASLVGSRAPNHWLDLAFQLVDLVTGLAPVALIVLLLWLRGARLADELGWRTDRQGRDLVRAVAVAAVVGGTGLGLYLAARALGLAVTVLPSLLPAIWWRIPILLLSAAQTAVLEEVVLLGWLPGRLGSLGWSWRRTVVSSALLRGSYHLYQGVGAFVGNALMGVLFGALARRWGRITPLVWAHFFIDAVAFVGAVLLAGHVSFLPR